MEEILGALDFQKNRNLILGAASYILAIECYHVRDVSIAPTPKKAVCGLRGAWLFCDIDEQFPGMGFDQVRDLLYLRASQYYSFTQDIMSSGSEPQVEFLHILGPDIDRNWGFEGVIYINSYLTNKYAKKLSSFNEEKEIEMLKRSRHDLGRLYGYGKVSFAKPSLIVEYARSLREDITENLNELNVSLDEGVDE